MSTSQVLYVLLSSFAAGLCLWATLSAAPSIVEHGRWHRAWTLTAGALLPLVTAAVVAGHLLDVAAAHALMFLLPPLVLACTWANATTLRTQGFALRALHFPTQAWNGLLFGLYSILVAQDLLGVDVGGAAGTLMAGFVDLQVRIGDPLAEQDPCWLYLPFALPLWLAYRWHHTIVLVLASAVSATLLALFTIGLPDAYVRTLSFRADPRLELASTAARTGLGVVVPWTERSLDVGRKSAFRSARSELRVEAVAALATPELFADEALVSQTRDELARAREEGLRTWVVVSPSRHFERMPARDLDELAGEIGKVQWLAAEQLRPEWLLLYVGPFGRLGEQIVVPPTVEDWMTRITRASKEARQANPEVRLAVGIETRTPHAKELFDRLHAATSPVDGVVLVATPGQGTREDAERTLAVQRTWCQKSTGRKPIFVLCEAGVPARLGGESGQARWLETVLAATSDLPHLEGFLVDALVDHGHGAGLWTREGRPRRAVAVLRRAFRVQEAATPR